MAKNLLSQEITFVFKISDNMIAMKLFSLIISLIIPGGSLTIAGRYKTALAIPLMGLFWVMLFSQLRWLITPTGFAIMLLGLLSLHLLSYLFGAQLILNNKIKRAWLILLLVIALNLIIIITSHLNKAQWFGFAFYHIPSVSMQPTLQVGDVILVDTWNKKANIQDIIVTKITEKSLVIVKRVSNTQITNNGKELFITGDNRYRSTDSRKFGWVKVKHLIGSVKFVWFSFKRKRWFKKIQ